ncbi:4-hydroxybenzoate octaprenyltransferase [Pararhodobacter oceanensis]|uniref:4-hydroxybenzoate octaprenyltransferase n=1 Tax=Pararhodobacter oceanensis TaxID=2172121 RepID=UPI003A8FF875
MTGTKQTPDAESGAEAQASVGPSMGEEGEGSSLQAGTGADQAQVEVEEAETKAEADTAIADRVEGSWVDTKAPDDMKPYLRLSRIDRPIGTWLLLLPCWWGALLGALATPGSSGLTTIWIMLVCGAGAVLMRGAGCTWNDISDRDIDGKVERTRNRPLVAGQVTVREALIWMGFQMFASFLLLLTLNGAAIALGFLALVPVAIYPFAKRFTWWPQVFLGLAFNWGALLAWTAQTGSLGMPAVILYIAGICWTLFYDTIYAHQDAEDDALIGVKSTARLFGENTEYWLRGFLVASVVLMSLAIIYALTPLADPLKLSLSLAGAWAFGAHLNWQLGLLKIDNSAVCLRLFRSNRDAGLIVVLIFAAALLV